MSFQNPFDTSIILIPQDEDGICFCGYIIIANKDEFRVNIHLKEKGSLKDARLDCSWDVSQTLKGYEEAIQKKLNQSSSIHEFLTELKALVENITSFSSLNDRPKDIGSHQLTEIFQEIEQIGWDKLVFTDNNFGTLRFVHCDKESREHILVLERQGAFSDFVASTNLPVNLQQKKNEKILIKYNKFVKIVDKCQLFWNVLKDLDEECWILEPEVPSYDCQYRRIALGKNSSLRIDVNPLQPSTFPECRFLGPSTVIDPLKQNLNKHMHLWDDQKGLLDNLRTVLDIEFPSKTTVEINELRVECGICYAYQLEDEIPDKSCEDTRCAQTFHSSCLLEWMRSLPSFRQSFNVVFGQCPYCEKKLTIKLKK